MSVESLWGVRKDVGIWIMMPMDLPSALQPKIEVAPLWESLPKFTRPNYGLREAFEQFLKFLCYAVYV